MAACAHHGRFWSNSRLSVAMKSVTTELERIFAQRQAKPRDPIRLAKQPGSSRGRAEKASAFAPYHGTSGSLGVLRKTHARQFRKSIFLLGPLGIEATFRNQAAGGIDGGFWSETGTLTWVIASRRLLDGFAGSFLPLKSNAGGNRARERQSLAIKTKLNNLTPGRGGPQHVRLALRTESCDERSAINVATVALLPAAALMRADAMRVLVLLRPTMARFAPSAASASAAANPMPLVAPVIRIWLSFTAQQSKAMATRE
jgi:hypothetical protein